MAKIDINKLARMITEDPDVPGESEQQAGIEEVPQSTDSRMAEIIKKSEDASHNEILSNRDPKAVFDELSKVKQELENVFYQKNTKIVARKSGGTESYGTFWLDRNNSRELSRLYQDFGLVASKVVAWVRSQARLLNFDQNSLKNLEAQYANDVVTIVTSENSKGLRINIQTLEDLFEGMYMALMAYENSKRRTQQ